MQTTRHIYRNTRDRKIGGVAAGLGDYLAIDPVIIRLAFILTVFLGGFGLVAYLVAWIIIPAGSPGEGPVPSVERRWDGRLIAGVVIAVIGAIAFAGAMGEWHHGPAVWPLLLVGGGAALILWRRDRAEPGPDPSEPEGGGPEPEDTASDSERSEETETVAIGGAQPPPIGAAVAVPGDTAISPLAPQPARSPRHRYPVGLITLGAVLLTGAVTALLDRLGVIDVSAQTFPLVSLGLCAAGVIAGALVGRVWGPLALGAVAAVAFTGVSLLDVPLEGGVGDRTVRPASAANLEYAYRLSAGKLVLDLSDVHVGATDEYVEASVGVGELIVIVPPGVVTVAYGSASAGDLDIFDRHEGGIRVDSSITGVPAGGADSAGRLLLDLGVGIGRIETRVAQAL